LPEFRLKAHQRFLRKPIPTWVIDILSV